MLLRVSSVMGPDQPALRMALSTASVFVHSCSGITSGRYVAVKVRLDEERRGRKREDDRGDGVLDDERDV